MMKPILAIAAALSLAIAGVGIADKSLDGGKCPGKCGLDCPGDCGVDCPGDCGPEGCKGCDDGCGHGEGKAKAADKTEAKANTGGARVTNTKLVSLKAETDAKGKCPGKCGPESCKGCDDGCGHGEAKAKATDKTEAKANTGGAGVTNTKLVSLKGEGHEPGHKCGHKGGHNGDHPEGHEGCKDKCGHGEGKAKAADKTEVKVNARVARVAVTK